MSTPERHGARRLSREAAGQSLRRAAHLEAPEGFRRGLGSPALFGIVQAFAAAAAYFAVGLVAERAQALTWLVFVVVAVFFVLLVLSYMEGTSLHQERGGATVIARYAFNELWSFVAGWAICLDYVILIALTALAAGDYAALFFPPLGDGAAESLMAAGIILAVAWLNVRGGGPRRYDRLALMVVADLALQLLVVLLGLALLFEPQAFTEPSALGRIPSLSDFLFASTLAVVAFAGIDASSGLAGQVRIGRRGLRRLLGVRFAAATVPLLGIAVVASSALPLGALREHDELVERPMLGIAQAFESDWISGPLQVLVAISGVMILVVACNAAMLGLSRLGYSLALNRQIPSSVARLHRVHATPWVVIAIGSVLALLLLAPADIEFLAGLYAFGATVTFTLVHLGILVLRRREPRRDRPFRVPLSVRWKGTDWPLPAVAGLLMSVVALVIVVTLHEPARLLGSIWMAVGVSLYVLYRLADGKPLLRRVAVPEASLINRRPAEVSYGSILVPIFGTPLDDDIMQTAGRLAAEQVEDAESGHATIEALWVFEIPLSQALDGPVAPEALSRARAALKRAKRVGEEYTGVEVMTATTRARRAGEAIVREARRRGVEAIVLAAEEPTRIRGGRSLGGKEGLPDSFVGPTTTHVVNKAPCRVILTAPPGAPAGEPEEAPEPRRMRSRLRRAGRRQPPLEPPGPRPPADRRPPPGAGADPASRRP